MTPMTKRDAFARAICMTMGWLLILVGATAQWGWPAALMVVGVFMAAPARYIAQDPIVVVD